jgi:hypothetical protein
VLEQDLLLDLFKNRERGSTYDLVHVGLFLIFGFWFACFFLTFGGAGFAYLSSDGKFTVNEPLVRLFLSGFVNETARKALLERSFSDQVQTAQSRGFAAELFFPAFLKRWERVPLDNFLIVVSTKPADIPKSLLGTDLKFHKTTTLVPIRQQVLFFLLLFVAYRCLCDVSSHSLLFQDGKTAVILRAIKTYQSQVGGFPFLVALSHSSALRNCSPALS